MSLTAADKRATFRQLHESGCFVLPNPWDVGSAKMLQHLGFKALATTSAGMAWSMGLQDGAVSLDEVLLHCSSLAHATDLPLNALTSRMASPMRRRMRGPPTLPWPSTPASPGSRSRTTPAAPKMGSTTSTLASSASRRPTRPFNAPAAACCSPPAARASCAARRIWTRPSRRLQRLRRRRRRVPLCAGPARRGPDPHPRLQGVAPAAVNLLSPGLSVEVAASLGVRRISVGGALASAAWGQALRAAPAIADHGTFTTCSPRAAAAARSARMFARRGERGPQPRLTLRRGVHRRGEGAHDVGQLQLAAHPLRRC